MIVTKRRNGNIVVEMTADEERDLSFEIAMSAGTGYAKSQHLQNEYPNSGKTPLSTLHAALYAAWERNYRKAGSES